MSAALSNDREHMRRILSATYNCPGNDEQVIRRFMVHACLRNYFQVVRILIDGGSSVQKMPDDTCSPLFAAAAADGSETLELLLACGASVERCAHPPYHPMLRCLVNRNLTAVRALERRGCSRWDRVSTRSNAIDYASQIADRDQGHAGRTILEHLVHDL